MVFAALRAQERAEVASADFGRRVHLMSDGTGKVGDLNAVAVDEIRFVGRDDPDVAEVDVAHEHVEPVQAPDRLEDRDGELHEVGAAPARKAFVERTLEPEALRFGHQAAREEAVGKEHALRRADALEAYRTRGEKADLRLSAGRALVGMVDLGDHAVACVVDDAFAALAEPAAERVGHAEFVADDVALDGRPVDAHGTVLKVDHARADGEGGVQGGRGLFDGGNGRLGNDLRNGLFLRTGRFAHVAGVACGDGARDGPSCGRNRLGRDEMGADHWYGLTGKIVHIRRKHKLLGLRVVEKAEVAAGEQAKHVHRMKVHELVLIAAVEAGGEPSVLGDEKKLVLGALLVKDLREDGVGKNVFLRARTVDLAQDVKLVQSVVGGETAHGKLARLLLRGGKILLKLSSHLLRTVDAYACVPEGCSASGEERLAPGGHEGACIDEDPPAFVKVGLEFNGLEFGGGRAEALHGHGFSLWLEGFVVRRRRRACAAGCMFIVKAHGTEPEFRKFAFSRPRLTRGAREVRPWCRRRA